MVACSSFNKKPTNQSGFTLIEMAIGLLVLGLLVSSLSATYSMYVKRKQLNTNLGNFTNVVDAVNVFTGREERYPLPASLVHGPGSNEYGEEVDLTSVAACSAGVGANGVCRTTGADPILIGAVPFKALGLNERAVHDYANNKILYAVTETQTVLYVPGEGKIITQALGYTGGVVQIDDDIDMIMISHGVNAEGAYTQEGTALNACGVGLDAENCDLDNTFMLMENEDVEIGTTGDTTDVGTTGFVAGANYYDDFTEFQQGVPLGQWLENLGNADYSMTLSSRIGVGTDDPKAKVHVQGDVLVDDDVLSDQLCPGNTTSECFNPSIIGGVEPQMNCDSNALTGRQPVVGLKESKVLCASSVDAGGGAISGEPFQLPGAVFALDNICSGDQVMIGLNNGVPVCQ